MGFADEFNNLDLNKVEMILGVLLVVAAAVYGGLTMDLALSGTMATAGVGLITLATAGKNAKKMDATATNAKQAVENTSVVMEQLKNVVLCSKPASDPKCIFEVPTAVKV